MTQFSHMCVQTCELLPVVITIQFGHVRTVYADLSASACSHHNIVERLGD